jgi:hypothetical protein
MELRIISLLVNFTVIVFIGLKTINTTCFNAGDINWAIGALIFSIITELYSLRKNKMIKNKFNGGNK